MRIDTFSNYFEFFKDFDIQLSRQLGDSKTTEIAKKVVNSNFVSTLTASAIKSEFLVGGKLIVEMVSSSRHFMFSRNIVVLYACMFTLSLIIKACLENGISFSEEKKLMRGKEIFLELRKSG